MSKRCARCGEFNPGRSIQPPGDWVDDLVADGGASEPVGTLTLPLCLECYAEARDLRDGTDEVTDDIAAFLDDLDPALFVDEVAG